MADKRNAINVLIKLLGGQEMTTELKQLGTTGEAALKKIDTAAKNVSFANVGNALHNFGSDITSTFERVALGIGAVSAAVSAAAPVILLLAKSGAEAADAAGKAAAGAGLQAEAYQKLAFAAGESDVSQQNFNTAMNAFNKQITKTADETVKNTGKMSTALKRFGADGKQAATDITQGAGYTVQAFKDIGVEVTRFGAAASKVKAGTVKAKTGFDDLGIKVKDTSGKLKDGEKLLLEVANAFQKMPDGARKSAIALKLFGLEGAKLIPFLNEGAKGIQALEDEAARLGIVFSDDQIKTAEAFNTSLGDLKKTVAGVSRQIGLLFAPAFTAGANAFRDIIVRNRAAILDFVRNGVQAATVFIKDFFATLSGRDADVTSNKWLISWRDAIVGFGSDFVHVATGVVIPAMQKVHEAADLLTGALNGIFGTNITTGEVLIGGALIRLVGGFRVLWSAVVLVVEAIASISTVLVANPWLIPIAAVAAGIAIWATSTSNATAALERHKEVVDEVDAAYQKAGGSLAKMTQEVRDRLSLETADALEKDTAAFNEALSNLVNKLPHFEGDLGNAAAQAMFAVAKSLQEGKISVEQFNSEITKIGAANIGNDVGKLAKSWLDMSKDATTTSGAVGEMADKFAFVTGKMTDADFAAKQAARGIAGYGQAAAAAAADTNTVGAAVDQTATKVQNLDHQISVFRGGGAGGQLSKEVFDVVDGVAHRADQGKQALDGLKGSVDDTSKAVDGVSNDITNSIGTIAPAAEQAAAGFNSSLGSLDAGAAQAAAEAIVAPFAVLPGQFGTILGGLRSLLQGGFANLSSIVTSLAAQINSQIASILSALREAAAAASALRAQAAGSSSSSSSGGGGSQGGFAGGGAVRGPGGPKSDSILAYLSNGEYVFTADAVKRIGVDVLNAWNYGKDVLAGFRGFNVGGFVDNIGRSLAIPRLAGGGMVPIPAGGGSAIAGASGLTHVRLDFGLGPQDVFDLIGEGHVVRKLQGFAVKSGLLSTGRKPLRGGK
ncbi:hypothetical protein EB230_23455 [Mesorhizobium sp. NZP2234]|uniref:phage tail tape measure protein n=1 Tax=Mesorhizobium sp. NZP2234 TaxID=2483402 RepID=UPI001553B600|nr:phage tail tape measure protein [Mesorhizobium sp. NZP2234]QKC91032.1 hypothetical protein EB230_23455 [Mesorhizobium sp. NZP2234]